MPFYQDRWFPTQHGHEDWARHRCSGHPIEQRCFALPLPLKADVGYFPQTSVVSTGTIAIQRVAIGIGIPYAQDKSEVDFLLQGGHLVFL